MKPIYPSTDDPQFTELRRSLSEQVEENRIHGSMRSTRMEFFAAKPALSVELLLEEAAKFSAMVSAHEQPALLGLTEGKMVGTCMEHKFIDDLTEKYSLDGGNLATAFDTPTMNMDIEKTSVNKPQSSCTYDSVRQKIFELAYS